MEKDEAKNMLGVEQGTRGKIARTDSLGARRKRKRRKKRREEQDGKGRKDGDSAALEKRRKARARRQRGVGAQQLSRAMSSFVEEYGLEGDASETVGSFKVTFRCCIAKVYMYISAVGKYPDSDTTLIKHRSAASN